MKRTPTPLNVEIAFATEGMSYTGAGFPPGGMLSKFNNNSGNPSVGSPAVGSRPFVETNAGKSTLFQADGSLQPGNMGGPIVEQETGKLMRRGRRDGVGRYDRFRDTGGVLAPHAGGPTGPPKLSLKAMNAKAHSST